MLRRQSQHRPSQRARTGCNSRRTRGNVQLVRAVFLIRPAHGYQEGVRHHRQGDMVMPTRVGATLKVIEPDFAFEILIITLDAPTQLCSSDQLLQ